MAQVQTAGERTVARVIQERRSVRLFKADPVPQELLIELLNVAVWAPTHGNRQPWRFILYKDGAKAAFADAVLSTYSAADKETKGPERRSYYMNVPAHLVVVMKEDPRQKQWDEDYAAACCLIQNFQLAAWEHGLGVVWKTNPFVYDPRFREAAGIQAGERVVGVLHIGYPEAIPDARPRTAAEALLTVVDSVLP